MSIDLDMDQFLYIEIYSLLKDFRIIFDELFNNIDRKF